MSRRPTELQPAILDEARRVLVEQGYDQLSMRRIASAVGCTATSIYLYYRSKDDLVHALIDEGMERLHAELRSAIDGVDDPRERLERLARRYLEFGVENPEYYEVMFLLRAEQMERYPPARYRRAHRNLDLFAETLAAARGADPLDEAALEALATAVWSSLHGAVSALIAQRIHVRTDRAALVRVAVAQAVASIELSSEAVSAADSRVRPRI